MRRAARARARPRPPLQVPDVWPNWARPVQSWAPGLLVSGGSGLPSGPTPMGSFQLAMEKWGLTLLPFHMTLRLVLRNRSMSVLSKTTPVL